MTWLIPLLSLAGMASAINRHSIRALSVFLALLWIGVLVVALA